MNISSCELHVVQRVKITHCFTVILDWNSTNLFSLMGCQIAWVKNKSVASCATVHGQFVVTVLIHRVWLIYKLYDLLVQHVTDIFMVVKFLFSCFSLASILSSYLKQFHKDHSFYPQTYFIFHYLWNGGFDQFFWRGGLDGKGEGNNFWSGVRVFRGTSVPLQQGGIRKTSKRLQIRNDNISSWLKLIFGKKKNIFLVTL